MLRGAIIGFGRMGLTHFSILNANPKVRIVAVCDSSVFILKNAARYLEVETFNDPITMFKKISPDFVVVATPTAAHTEIVQMAITRGVHVFVEKPFALNTEQGQAVLNAIEQQPVVNQVGYVLRFSDTFIQVKKLIEDKAIGELLNFKMEMCGPTVLHGAKNSWRSSKNKGGGCLYDFASHGIDMINYLIGAPDEIAGTALQSIYSNGVEDAVTSTFFYYSGARGTLLVNWSDESFRKPTYRFEAFGRYGRIIADMHEYRVFLKTGAAFNGHKEGWNRRYVTDFFRPVSFYLRGYEFTRQLEHFVNCISNGLINQMCSFAQAHQTDIVIERLREDAKRRQFCYG